MSLDSHTVRWSEMTPRCPGFGPFGPVWSGSPGSGAVRPQYACFRGEPGSGFPVIRGSHGTVLGGAGHGVPAPALAWAGVCWPSVSMSQLVGGPVRLGVPAQQSGLAVSHSPRACLRSRLTQAALRGVGVGPGFLPHRWHWLSPVNCPSRCCIRIRLGAESRHCPPVGLDPARWARGFGRG